MYAIGGSAACLFRESCIAVSLSRRKVTYSQYTAAPVLFGYRFWMVSLPRMQ